jgi:hypothetical protein
MLRNQGVSAPVSAVIIYRCSDYTNTFAFIISFVFIIKELINRSFIFYYINIIKIIDNLNELNYNILISNNFLFNFNFNKFKQGFKKRLIYFYI